MAFPSFQASIIIIRYFVFIKFYVKQFLCETAFMLKKLLHVTSEQIIHIFNFSAQKFSDILIPFKLYLICLKMSIITHKVLIYTSQVSALIYFSIFSDVKFDNMKLFISISFSIKHLYFWIFPMKINWLLAFWKE